MHVVHWDKISLQNEILQMSMGDDDDDDDDDDDIISTLGLER